MAGDDDSAADEHRTRLGRGAHDAADLPCRRRPWVVIGSKGGAPDHPDWYKNLAADPDATIQVKGERIPVHARTATGSERTRLWQLMAEVWPPYDEYQQRTEREIPVVVFERRVVERH